MAKEDLDYEMLEAGENFGDGGEEDTFGEYGE